MAEIEFTAVQEGDPFDAASLVQRFAQFKAAINDVETNAVDRGAFNENHLPSLVRDAGQITLSFTKAVYHKKGLGGLLKFDTVAANGPGTSPQLEVKFRKPYDLTAASDPNGIGGVLVMADVGVKHLSNQGTPYIPNAPQPAFSKEEPDRYAIFRIEASADQKSWTTIITRFISEGFFSDSGLIYDSKTSSQHGRPQWFSLPLHCLIKRGDLKDNQILAIRVTVGLGNRGTARASNIPPLVELGPNAHLSALVLHSSPGPSI